MVFSFKKLAKSGPKTLCALVGIVASITFITPVVSVPVLSRITTSTLRASSKTRGWRRTMPRDAPRPDATKSATGVAKPSAQGHAITKTVIAI